MSSSGEQSQPPPQKKNLGRRKLPMKKMENESNLQVTFSKRRAGLFKKASELCTLTGTEASIVVFSPGNKAYSFGHPNVHTIMNRFLENSMNVGGNGNRRANPRLQRELDELTRIEGRLQAERARKKDLAKSREEMEKDDSFITHSMIENMSLEELETLRDSVLKFKSNFEAHVKQQKSTVDDREKGHVKDADHVIPYEKDETTEIGGGGEGGSCSKDGNGAAAEMDVDRLDDGFGRRFF